MRAPTRFNQIKYYSGGGAPRTLSGPNVKIPKFVEPEIPPGVGAQAVQGLSKVAAAFFKADKDKKDKAAKRADEDAATRMIEALTTRFDTSKYGASPQTLMAAAEEMPEGEEDDAWAAPSPEEQREFYTDQANKTQSDYGSTYGAGLVRANQARGDYNTQDNRDWLAKLRDVDEPKGMGPESRSTMRKILLGDMAKTDAAELLASKREYERSVAKNLSGSKLAAARAKPGTDPTSYKEWKLSGSKLSFEQWLQKRDYAKMGLRPPGESGEPPAAIPGGPADIKQQRIKLQETSNTLLRQKVELMERKSDPAYITKIEGIRKSAGYLIDLKKSQPKARGAVNTLKMKGEKVAAIVAEALPLAQSMFAAGPGSMLKGVWNTDSRRLAGLLTNLKAIIGFDTLAEMRANSPTGGALGQVSNIEINLLQAVQGTLDQGQQELLIRSLTDIKGNYPRLLSWAEERFKEQYAPLNPPSITVPPPPAGFH